MSSHYQIFKALHETEKLFLLPNAWNAESAFVLQTQGFPAIATSSAAVANTLGYDDGEKMPFEEYLFIIKRMVSSIHIPLTVDLEMGYGVTAEEIITNILKLTELGIVGINLEDSRMSKQKRFLQDAVTFARKLATVKNQLAARNIDLFVNVRCDTYLLNVDNKQTETIDRVKLYESSGADGIFLPCICAEEDIRAAVQATILPINVMSFPGLPDFEVLNELDVKRLSLGGFLLDAVYKNLKIISDEIKGSKSVSFLFPQELQNT